MTIDEKINDGKAHYNITREAVKIASPSVKIDKYEYLTGEEILPPDQSQIIQKTRLAYSPLGKALEKRQKQLKITGKNRDNA